ncbi:ATP-dependent DNA ligase [Prochlorococcus marinus]|uniref:ATP-dependent DNA ligase n=1 Tax=Prochlorococcus marinus TaxID=1219 RepID=UPI0001900A55|nr:ATP-dependent DNA ligase [Prochlorococcus marinus]EEE39285.1 DNA ligase [Prochlorococcus marinus str. MIT 9202]
MSLKKFSELFEDLDSINSTNNKIELLKSFFLSNEPIDNSWAIYLLTGKSNKRFISGRSLKNLFSQIYEYPQWLIDTCYLKVGDSAEVITLLLKNKTSSRNKKLSNISLNELLSKTIPNLSILNEKEKNLEIKNLWETLPEDNHLIFNKILTGTFRVGVSIGLITKSISKLINIDEEIISHRLMGNFKPSIDSYEFLTNKNINLEELNSKPFPFLLANTFEDKIFKNSINNFQFEWKYDGIRIQLIKRSGNVSLWTRGQELVNESFPELVEKMSYIKDNFVLDGELLVWNFKEKIPFDFHFLQKRINRKSPTRSIQIKYPIIFIAYDLLEINGRDIREIKLENRRIELEKYFSKWRNKAENNITDILTICDLIYPKDWPDALTFKEKSRQNNTEGLIIKNKMSPYTSGRKKGIWWKYKVDPMQLDAVLIYAKGGSGRRAGLYTDYSFALWKGQELIKFASAYSGLTNIEIKELDKWIRKNTIEKFGPVRSLKPEMVFEISFEKIQISKRHKSGIAVRFPRITKWRKDKKINDADSLENAYELMKKIS